MGRFSLCTSFWYRASRASTALSEHGDPSDRRFPDFQCAWARGGGVGGVCLYSDSS